MTGGNCLTCGATLAEQNRERDYQTLYNTAKAYAKENQVLVIIYQDPIEGPQFIEAEKGKALGLIPSEFVSQY